MKKLQSSFRDDAGFVYRNDDGRICRAITHKGRSDYDLLMSSGLYEALVSSRKLIAHRELLEEKLWGSVEKIILPEFIPFISYPYEWSFSQFKDAALLTLDIQAEALRRGLSLKDASFFNVQFKGAFPIFIDTLSFEKREDKPWIAYRQFCEHFLGPLLLMSYVSVDFNRHFTSFLDGIPLALTKQLLPLRAKLKLGTYFHIVLHEKTQRQNERTVNVPNTREKKSATRIALTLNQQLALIDNLRGTIASLHLPKKAKQQAEWLSYAESNHNYTEDAERFKRETLSAWIDRAKPAVLWDLGGNTGNYSRLATSRGVNAICFDLDPMCVDHNYHVSQSKNDAHMLPLVMNLVNPSPAIGWAHCERDSLLDRGPADLLLALALVHHLRITANVPLEKIAEFMSRATRGLIIEFVPKGDSMVSCLLKNREDIFSDYTQDEFERCFSTFFTLRERQPIPGSLRTLYYFER